MRKSVFNINRRKGIVNHPMKRTISKRLVVLLLMTAFTLSLCSVSAFAADATATSVNATVKVSNPTFTDSKSDPFRVAIDLSLGSGVSGIAAYVVTVNWDPSVLQLVASGASNSYCSFTDTFGDGWNMIPDSGNTVVNADPSKGTITVSSGSAANRATADGTLFLLEFKPLKAAANTEIKVSLGSSTVSAQAALSSESGKITNVVQSTTLKLSVAGDTTVVRGDINGNGIIDAQDCFMARRAFFGLMSLKEKQLQTIDFNHNGAVDAGECLKLRRAYFGLSPL